MKAIRWQGSSYEDLRAFPAGARREAGFQLDKVQRGQNPDDWKPISSIGPGVREIRIREASDQFRVIYAANFSECIYVLHAFQKKSQKIRSNDLRLAKARFKAIGDNQ